MKNLILLVLPLVVFTTWESKAHPVTTFNYGDKKEEVKKTRKVANFKGVTLTIELDTSLIVGNCTVTVSRDAETSSGVSSASASATAKNCRKAERRAKRKLRRIR